MPDDDDDSLDGAPPPPPVRHAAPPPPVPPRSPRPAPAPRGSLLPGLLIGLLIALPLAGVAFAAGHFLPRGETAPGKPADPPKALTRGDEFLARVNKLDDEAKRSDRAAAKLPDILKDYQGETLAGLLRQQEAARIDLEKANGRLKEDAGKADKKQKDSERRLKLARGLLELQSWRWELAMAKTPPDREWLDRGKQLDELTGKLNGDENDLKIVEEKTNTLKSMWESMRRQVKPGPGPGPAGDDEPSELALAKHKMMEYFQLKNNNKGEEKKAKQLKKEAMALLEGVIQSNPKHAEKAKMMMKRLQEMN